MKAAERAAAKSAGLKTYFTGKPCPQGHVADRFVSKGACVVCTELAKQNRRAEKPELVRAQGRARRLRNIEHHRARDRRLRIKNIDRVRSSLKAWRSRNPNYDKNKRRSCIQTLLRHNLRTRLRMAVANNAKCGSAVRDLGCSIAELKVWLESQFHPGMTWENYGEWHIDHRLPLASFDLTRREEVLIACNWQNLQPLWALDNLSKGARVA